MDANRKALIGELPLLVGFAIFQKIVREGARQRRPAGKSENRQIDHLDQTMSGECFAQFAQAFALAFLSIGFRRRVQLLCIVEQDHSQFVINVAPSKLGPAGSACATEPTAYLVLSCCPRLIQPVGRRAIESRTYS